MAISPLGAQQPVDPARLSDILKNAQDKYLQLSQKLIKIGVQYKVGDPALGTRIDTSA